MIRRFFALTWAAVIIWRFAQARDNAQIKSTSETDNSSTPADNSSPVDTRTSSEQGQQETINITLDLVQDSIYDSIQGDTNCDDYECRVDWSPPDSTLDEDPVQPTTNTTSEATCRVDKHWGADPSILEMRDQLRESSSSRPPIFLMPGLASTRLVAWKHKTCRGLLSDIRVQDHVWLNLNLFLQMTALDDSCLKQCLMLGLNQSDSSHDDKDGCKLRPDEGLDAIASLSPGNLQSNIFVGGTNTVYAWLIQWLADHLGYDVSTIVGLPYDWRLSPDKLEQRDGFLTHTRHRLEAAVRANGRPGIMISHSMGNTIFRYFLQWLRLELRQEAFESMRTKARRRARRNNSTELPSEENLRELSKYEGDQNWYDWMERHIWTYIGLSAPLLGAVNPLRAVISGENMGMPITDEVARSMEKTFGSTHTISPLSSKMAFCDEWEDFDSWLKDEHASGSTPTTTDSPIDQDEERPDGHADSRLACLDDIMNEIENTSNLQKSYQHYDPWENFPALKALLRDRLDWDSHFPMFRIIQESCETREKTPCKYNSTLEMGPKDVENGEIFRRVGDIWREKDDPMFVKYEQLRESFWDTPVPNILNQTWERPLIKHVIMAYGVDIPTEVGYEYIKSENEKETNSTDSEYDNIPTLQTAIWETAKGKIEHESLYPPKPILPEFWKKTPKRKFVQEGRLEHSGDGSVPYLSLAWAHTWLLHGVRARRFSGKDDGPSNPLNEIEITHRVEGGTEWIKGPPPKRIKKPVEKKFEESNDTGTSHPHGTKYKPQMTRYQTIGTSRTTGIQYTTSVLEAIMVEHNETTRNYDILAAVFTDVLKFMHEDFAD